MVEKTTILAVVFLLLMWSASALAQPADLIYPSGNIHTMDPARPRAQAVAMWGSRIAAVGSDAEVLEFAGPFTQRVDLQGRTVLPGLSDSHGHMFGRGLFGLGRMIRSARTSR